MYPATLVPLLADSLASSGRLRPVRPVLGLGRAGALDAALTLEVSSLMANLMRSALADRSLHNQVDLPRLSSLSSIPLMGVGYCADGSANSPRGEVMAGW
jgi:hypothetical protein